MLTFHKYPILRPLLCLCGGIVFYDYWSLPIRNITIGVLICLALAIIFSNITFRYQSRIKAVTGLVFMSLFFLMGMLCTARKDDKIDPNWIGKQPDTTYTVIGTINSSLMLKSKSYQASFKPFAIKDKDIYWKITSGEILLWIDTTLNNRYQMQMGDTIVANIRIRSMANNPKLPTALKQYYQHQQLYQQASLHDYNLIQYKKASTSVANIITKTRTYFVKSIARFIHGKDEHALASALLIGYKDELPKPLENAYRDAGIVHIIAISGMHLILFYAFFNKTLGMLLRKIQPRYVAIISLLICWIFSFVSGASPSVIRACVMLSFIVFGPIINRQSDTINSLLVSAFILLVIRPDWIWNVGFWLSYIAVLSIILWNPIIRKSIDFDNKLLHQLWRLISVTLAAQVLTLPILLYCFGSFPIYFLITNLFMIPLSTLVLYGLLLLILFSWVPYLNEVIGKLTDYGLYGMNAFVNYVAQYPFAKISYQISFIQMMVLYLFLFLLYDMIRKKTDRKNWEYTI